MAVVTAVKTGIGVFNGIRSLGIFGGGGGKDRRRQKRLALKEVGFNLIENGPDYNMDSYYDQALDNLGALYEQYGQTAVDVHNKRKIPNNAVAENYQSLEQIVLAEKEQKQESQGALGFITDASGDRKIVNAGASLLGAVALGGGLLWLVNKG